VAALAACGPTSSEREAMARESESGFRGILLAEPLPKADFTLTDTDGRPFRFRRETDGYLTLLFFGYTSCPDVCPVQMANLAAVIRDADPELGDRTKVLFVTTDPERDTPSHLAAWLARFRAPIVGLTGTPEEIEAVEKAFALPPSTRIPDGGGGYTVGHAAQVIAFSPDGRRTVVYPAGTRQSDWAHDLPKLAAQGGP
jgi:protein SCO1/2